MGKFSQGLAERVVPTKEAEGGYDGPPRFYWANGEFSKKSNVAHESGEFYIPERELKGFVPGAPWERQEGRFAKGDVFYVTKTLGMVLICRRSRPYADLMDSVTGKKTGVEFHPFYVRDNTPKPWPQGVTKPSNSVRTEYLCIPDGFQDPSGDPSLVHEALFVTKGMVGIRMQKVVVPMFEEEILKEAQRAISSAKGEVMNELPAWWMFHIELEPETELIKGKRGAEDVHEVLFTEVERYNIKLNLPVLVLPDDGIDMAWLDANYVGDTEMNQYTDIYDQYKKWRDEAKTVKQEAAPSDDHDEGEGFAQTSFDPAAARAALKGKIHKASSLEDELDASDLPFAFPRQYSDVEYKVCRE